MFNYSVNIVVARHNENVDWLVPLKDITFIQNNGDIATIHQELRQNTNTIKNIGLDQYCHLRYIIDNYDNLPDVIVFTQADIEPHKDVFHDNSLIDNIDALNKLHVDAYIYGHSMNARNYIMKHPYLNTTENMKVSVIYPDEEDSGYTYGKWFDKFVRKDYIFEKHLWFKNAIFSVQKKYILSQPLNFYRRIINQIHTRKGEVLHYIERSWYYMLNMDKNLNPYSFRNIRDNYSFIFNTLDKIVLDYDDNTNDLNFLDNKRNFCQKLNVHYVSERSQMILKFGFDAGHMTALMLLSNPTSKIVHIEPYYKSYSQDCYEFLKSVFGKHRLLQLYEGEFKYLSDDIKLKYTNTFDFIYLDGSEKEDILEFDILNTRQLLLTNGTVIIDYKNIQSIKSVIYTYMNKNILIKSDEDFASTNGYVLQFIGKYSK